MLHLTQITYETYSISTNIKQIQHAMGTHSLEHDYLEHCRPAASVPVLQQITNMHKCIHATH